MIVSASQLLLSSELLVEPVGSNGAQNSPHALAPPLDHQHAVSDLCQSRAILERVGQEAMQIPVPVTKG